jgi:hypothetical protein
VNKETLRPESSLQKYDQKAIDMRSALLVKFSKAFSQALKYVTIEDRELEGSISNYHYKSKGMCVATAINQIVDR